MNKVFVVGKDHLVQAIFKDEPGFEVVYNHKEANIIVFTGGADVSPGLYGHPIHPTTRCAPQRDHDEVILYEDTPMDALVVGICRGAQFLCVMNGGTLYQDVDRHAIYDTHSLVYKDEKGVESLCDTTSTHHQMQNPFCPQDGLDKLNFEMWGWADRSTYRTAVPEFSAPHKDVEILYWPETHCLGFQGHPEYGSKECRELFFTCVNRALQRKVN